MNHSWLLSDVNRIKIYLVKVLLVISNRNPLKLVYAKRRNLLRECRGNQQAWRQEVVPSLFVNWNPEWKGSTSRLSLSVCLTACGFLTLYHFRLASPHAWQVMTGLLCPHLLSPFLPQEETNKLFRISISHSKVVSVIGPVLGLCLSWIQSAIDMKFRITQYKHGCQGPIVVIKGAVLRGKRGLTLRWITIL